MVFDTGIEMIFRLWTEISQIGLKKYLANLVLMFM